MVKSNGKSKEMVRFCRNTAKKIAPQKDKVKIHPNATTPKHIALLSPGIEDNFSLLRYQIVMTLDKITPQNMEFPVIRNMPKTDNTGSDYHYKEYDYHNGVYD